MSAVPPPPSETPPAAARAGAGEPAPGVSEGGRRGRIGGLLRLLHHLSNLPGMHLLRHWLAPHGGRLRRVRAVAVKEVRQLARDRLALGFITFLPLVQLVLFGYAINQDVRGIATAVLDRSNSAVSRRAIEELVATQAFRLTRATATEEEGRRLLARGAVQAVIVVPDDFARSYYRGRGAEISILVDATDPLRARAVRAAAEGLEDVWEARVRTFRVGEGGAQRSARLGEGRFEVAPELIHTRAASFRVLTYFNPELRTPVFVVPGLLGVILTTTMILMTALALVRERQRGTFEFLIGTPVRRFELMVGKILPYIVIGLVQMTLVLLAGLVLFRVPIRGSWLSLGVASALFIAANLTLGLVISSLSRTQNQATQMSFFFFLPSVLLSGFMFSFEAMPRPAQWLGELLPLTHYIRVCRAIMLRGTPLWDLGGEMVALTLFFAAGLAAATRLFHKTLD
jgi:ABC-2 type transport system permease protein